MNLNDVMDELGDKLSAIEGLRVLPFDANSILPPSAIFALPDKYDFDETYGRGSDSMTLPISVLVGRVSDRASRVAIGAYASGSGAKSVKAALDSTPSNGYTSCDTVRVASVEFGVITVAAVGYLGATFNVDISGSGS